MHRRVADREVQVERELAHPVLRPPIGVRQRPLDRPLPELAVVRRDVRTAAVLEVPGDRVVVVAVDRRDLALGDQGDDLVWVRPVPDQISSADDAVDAELVNAGEGCFERREVAMDVGDDGEVAGLVRHW